MMKHVRRNYVPRVRPSVAVVAAAQMEGGTVAAAIAGADVTLTKSGSHKYSM